ncbi:phospholipid methyltransferase [Laceyella sacchari]|uniref:Phospholipid N-methyltransferase n=1 Tax=Laceyella tengchongensis TaxID=574699 RepID=A0AA45WQV5_9BACL|nr:phospholipid methyltransferase [Laceyella sacchari]SMP28105.1 Phospholipid N-methyltransferase [Laceyella tengchongensis]
MGSMTILSQPWVERLRFFHTFIKTPHLVGSVAPSSRYLTKAMMSKIPFSSASTIVELGAGTGVFTKALAQLAQPGSHVMIFEQDEPLRKSLQTRFPQFQIESDALELLRVLEQNKLGRNQVDVIVSGLPFACFSQGLRDALLEQVTGALKPGGMFVAFQYSLQMKRQFSEWFAEMSLEFVPMNLPPAFVYTCRTESADSKSSYSVQNPSLCANID